MSNYRSTAAIYPQCIDSRRLCMEAVYFLLTKEQATGFARSFLEWCAALWQKDFIITWHADNKKMGLSRLLEAIGQDANYAVGLEGTVMCEQIPNPRAFRRFLRDVERYENTAFPSDASSDYMDFFLSQKEQLESGKISWKEFILSFFREQGRVCLSAAPVPELQGSIFGNAYRHDSTLYYGSVSVMISVYSAGENVAKLADEMTCFLTSQSKLYRNINGHIGITPLTFPSESSAHMCYFGHSVDMDGSHENIGVEPREWYPYYYLRAAEWFNLISPLAKTNIPSLMEENTQHPTVKVQKLNNGAVIICVDTPPEQVDTGDLLPVKQLLYDGLYPGMRELPKEICLDMRYIAPVAKVRMQWECLPVLDDEIVITSDSVIFRHKKCANLKHTEAEK